MDNQSDCTLQKVTLILYEDQTVHKVTVDKAKLVRKSRYFEALYSHNFADSNNNEHIINYGINLRTLQDFAEWIHDDGEICRHDPYPMKYSVATFIQNDENKFVDLLHLLRLSIIFVTDDLTNDIIDIIVVHWFQPKRLIDIWILAEELGITVLRDICFSVCLDNMEMFKTLLASSKDNIIKLKKYVNLKHLKRLNYLMSKWTSWPVTEEGMHVSTCRLPKLLVSMVGYNCIAKKMYVYVWDNVRLSQLTQMYPKHIENSEKALVGTQLIGKGFSVYMIGGEFGIGSCRFNRIIWRYCLVSKRWYYQTKLATARRHMVVAFCSDKLLLVGGVGCHRIALSSGDILDMHTGEWTKMAKVPETFTEVPPYCVLKNTLYIFKSALYVYFYHTNTWKTVRIKSDVPIVQVTGLMDGRSTLFLTDVDSSSEVILYKVNYKDRPKCDVPECQILTNYNSTTCVTVGSYHVDLVHTTCDVNGTHINILSIFNDVSMEKYKYLHVHSEKREDLNGVTLNPAIGYFNVIDPETMYDETCEIGNSFFNFTWD